MENLEIGDVVCLQGAEGPHMTVTDITGESIGTTWFVQLSPDH